MIVICSYRCPSHYTLSFLSKLLLTFVLPALAHHQARCVFIKWGNEWMNRNAKGSQETWAESDQKQIRDWWLGLHHGEQMSLSTQLKPALNFSSGISFLGENFRPIGNTSKISAKPCLSPSSLSAQLGSAPSLMTPLQFLSPGLWPSSQWAPAPSASQPAEWPWFWDSLLSPERSLQKQKISVPWHKLTIFAPPGVNYIFILSSSSTTP